MLASNVGRCERRKKSMNLYVVIITIAISFLITVLLSPIFIPFLRRLKFGQSIRTEGPKSHMQKTGTPTMGGVMIIISTAVTVLIMMFKFMESSISYSIWLLLLVLIGYGLLGFLDDFIKVAMKRNLGLTSKQKLAGQLVIAIIFYITLYLNDFPTYIGIPGTSIQWELGHFRSEERRIGLEFRRVLFRSWLLLLVLIGYGLLGFLDDFIKVAMKRNLGLTSKQKLAGQLVIAIIFYITLYLNDFPTYIGIPGTSIQWELGHF